MRSTALVISLLFVLGQALAVVACQSLVAPVPTPSMISPTALRTPSPPTPTPLGVVPETGPHSYFDPTLGISLTYPADWLVRQTEKGVVFGTSSQAIAGGELTEGAGLAVYAAALPDPGLQSAEELCLREASVFESEAMEISAPVLQRVGGREGAAVTLQGVPPLSHTQIRGLVAVVFWKDWAYTFVALSAADEWAAHGPVLQELLAGLEFVTRETPEYQPDAWEPDDGLAVASETMTGSSQTHDLHRQGDQDYLRFQATRGYVYTVETAHLGADIDTRIYLYDSEGKLLAHNDDGRGLEELWASRLIWTAERTDVLYVMVEDVGGDDAGPGTTYDIRVWEEARFVEDEYEPDESMQAASLLESGISQTHNLHAPGDHDWSYFDARAGSTYVVETLDLGPGVDTVLHLFDDQGNELVMDDNGRAEEEPLASRVRWMAQEDATVYVMVHDLDDDRSGPGTEYSMRVLEVRS